MGDVNIKSPYSGDQFKKLSEATDNEVRQKLKDTLGVDWKEDPTHEGLYVSAALNKDQAQEITDLGKKIFKISFKSEEFGGSYHAEVDKKAAFKILQVSKEAILEMKKGLADEQAMIKGILIKEVAGGRLWAGSDEGTKFIKDFVTNYLAQFPNFPQSIPSPTEDHLTLMNQLLQAFRKELPLSKANAEGIAREAFEVYSNEAAKRYTGNDLGYFQSMLSLGKEADFLQLKITEKEIKDLGASILKQKRAGQG